MKKLLIFTLLIPTLGQAAFNDVSNNNSYHEAINYLQQQAVVGGYPDGSFKPDRKINRAEFTKIIVESQFSSAQITACTSNAGFTDVTTTDWFAPYVCVAKSQGIVGGYPDKTFRAGNTIVLSEAAKIVAESFNLTVDRDLRPWFAPYLQRLTDLNAIPPSLTEPANPVRRGEMAELIYRLETEQVDQAASQIKYLSSSQSLNAENFDDNQKAPLLELINQARKDNGLNPLVFDNTLNQVAQNYAQQMDDENFFSHQSPNGDGPDDRARDAGYNYRFVGENIAKGQVTAQYAFDTWKDSPGHWANILKSEYKETGLGQVKVTNDSLYKGYIWVQVFGTKQ